MLKLSMKKLRELHEALGGNDKGYHIVRYSRDIETGEIINTAKNPIATHQPTNANWHYQLIIKYQEK